MKKIFFLAIALALYAKTLYFANQNFYPLDPFKMNDKVWEKINSYKFVILNIEDNGSVYGYYELYPYAAPFATFTFFGKYDPKSGEIKVVANGWLHRLFYYKNHKLILEEPNAPESIHQVNATTFAKRYIDALKSLQNYEPAARMRRLGIAFEVQYNPLSDAMQIYPIGLQKVSNLDPEAGALGFLELLLEKGGWEKGKVTPQMITQKFPAFAPSDFANTGRLDNFLDGLILLDNYLKRVGLDPFKPEHLEEIEEELFAPSSTSGSKNH